MFGITSADIIAWVLFGGIGMIAFAWGKMRGSWKILVLAGALMFYPYFVGQGIWLWVIGVVLTVLLPFARD